VVFRTIAYLQAGSNVQRRSFAAIDRLGILQDLQAYSPLLCGTIPLGIDIPGSDLDIVLEVHDLVAFQKQLQLLYSHLPGFRLASLLVTGVPTVTCNFQFSGFDFELFAQPQPAEQQNAYLHLLVEHHLLTAYPQVRAEIIRLKRSGLKTEPAFARVFGLSGDPYEQLLRLGSEMGVIKAPAHTPIPIEEVAHESQDVHI
jgi:hypothetical protein